MADPTHPQLADHFHIIVWLTWQTRRWRPVYRSAVAQCLRGLRRDIGILSARQQALNARGRAWITARIPDVDAYITKEMETRDRLAACRRVYLAYRDLIRYLRQFERNLTPEERRALARAEGHKYAALNHAVMDMVAPCLTQDVLD